MAGPSPHRGYSTVWSKARKNCELEWRNLPSTEESAHCSLCWPIPPFRSNLSAFLFLMGSYFVSGCIGVRGCFQSLGAPYGADMLQRAGDVQTPKHTQSRCQKRDYLEGFSITKAGRNAFLILATFPCERVRLWPMTRDRCSQLMRSDAASGGR